MLSDEVITKLKTSTCAVVRMEIKHEEALPTNVKVGDRVKIPSNDVKGTAMLVADGVVLTNRHVVELILRAYRAEGNLDHWYLQFTFPRSAGGWSQSFARITEAFALVDPAGSGRVDAGFLSFRFRAEMEACRPVEFGELARISIGNEVAICGYPLGTELLANPRLGIRRFGPVIHRGMVSAVAPYDNVDPRSIEMFLTDLSTADGMSGAPVFSPADGRVIGMHYAGTQRKLGCAIPIDEQRVSGWIRLFRRCMEDSSAIGEVRLTNGGDILEP